MNVLTVPVISVIMPVYNSGKYIEEAVGSILNQTYSNFELIIIDDGSTDSSWEKIQQLEDMRIIRLQNEKNSGVIASYINGFKVARGRFIAYMDSDDTASLDRLAKQVEFLDNHPEVSIVSGALKYVSENGEELNRKWAPPTNPKLIKWTLFFENAVVNSAAMIRREVFTHFIENPPKLRYAYDYESWAMFSEQYLIANLPDILHAYRMHSSNYSFSHLSDLRDEDVVIKKKLVEDFLGMSIPEGVTEFIAKPVEDQPNMAINALNLLQEVRRQFFSTVDLSKEEKEMVQADFMKRYYPIFTQYSRKSPFILRYFYLYANDPPYRKKLMQKIFGRARGK